MTAKIRYAMTLLSPRYFFLPQIIAVFFGYIVWLATDRTPPLTLFDGQIIPNIVRPGEQVSILWQAYYSGRDCPGDTQREQIDSKRHLYTENKRARAGVFKAAPGTPFLGTVETPPLNIPDPPWSPGRAKYRVTQFYYCNWFQRLTEWPIVQVSPFIFYEVTK